MDYKYLGASALKVSPICLGTMMFGGPTSDAEAQRIVDTAHAAGINFIDTADVYNGGASETVVGRAVAKSRDDWIVATKFVNPNGTWPNKGGVSRKWIFETVDSSLRRLGTDYIDLLYFHRAVPDAPLEEAVAAIGDLIRIGKLRYYGVSNFRGWRVGAIAGVADRQGVPRPVASQPLYNIVSRGAETEEIPAAHAFGLGVVTYSPLARGVLTGKYRADAPVDPDSRVGRGDPRIRETEFRRESLEAAQRIAERASGRGIRPGDFALAWVLANSLVSSVIAGPRTIEQWENYLKALDVHLDAEDEAFVDGLVPPGHSSTPYHVDPRYPIEGRKSELDRHRS